MTRSNEAGDIGFMASPERVNVLLSRARNALFMIGNANTFAKSRKVIQHGSLCSKHFAKMATFTMDSSCSASGIQTGKYSFKTHSSFRRSVPTEAAWINGMNTDLHITINSGRLTYAY